MFPVTERRVSFYPMVQVHDSDDDVLEDESQEFWYSPKELQTMERYAQDTARRMSLHYKLRRNDCKRGIENLTSQGLLATRTVRMNALVAVLAEQSQHSSREYIAEVYGRIVQSASIRAYDQASVDAYEAAQVHGRRNEQQYDKEEEDDDNDNVNCWFWKTTAQWLRTISQSRQNRIAPSPGL